MNKIESQKLLQAIMSYGKCLKDQGDTEAEKRWSDNSWTCSQLSKTRDRSARALKRLRGKLGLKY